MSDPQGEKGTVLVIEDDPDICDYMTAILNDHGYRTEVVMDGAVAFERACTLQPNGITLDILLPGRTGIALYRKLRKAKPTRHIPIVIVTGVGTEGKVLDVGLLFSGRAIPPPQGVLQKPVGPDELLRTVDTALLGAGS